MSTTFSVVSTVTKVAQRPVKKDTPQISVQRIITPTELRDASTPEKAWIAIRDEVFDLTAFTKRHPGGQGVLLAAVGRDATALFESIHDVKAAAVLKKFRIGTLGDHDLPRYPAQGTFTTELHKRAAAYFQETKQDSRYSPWSLVSYLVIVGTWIVSYPMTFNANPDASILICVLGAILQGWSLAMAGIYILHDSSHSSFTHNPKVWDAMGRLYEIMTGFSTWYWKHQHVIGHHAFTNVVDVDPDITLPAPGPLRIYGAQPWYWYYQFQNVYWPFLYSQLVLARRMGEFHSLFLVRRISNVPINCPSTRESAWSIAGMLSALTQRVLVPYFVLGMDGYRLWWLNVLIDGAWSLYLMLIFQLSHVNDDVAWPVPDADTGVFGKEWAVLQIEASMDFAHGDLVTTCLTGSLNYQAVHHLFPHVNQIYYPDLAVIVKDLCSEFGVQYHLKGSWLDGVKAHVRQITASGIFSNLLGEQTRSQ
ncbi:hypothetical protein N0V93_009738 [Gnomoniopsis smithogilvyi]|uniref:Delta 8-(E)-sphingolipid desaturase n=1 Tax=Gnomoniopsis smithogilvyi TaxID=1191159 RepID=A0A9W8YND4_9PEZI|nr:hypothetical protein N0V93_009738 [Gnomoniopsis smithogilvyi]